MSKRCVYHLIEHFKAVAYKLRGLSTYDDLLRVYLVVKSAVAEGSEDSPFIISFQL